MMSPAERYEIMVKYLNLKVYEKDWHGVADAAMDIRELVAKHPEVQNIPEPESIVFRASGLQRSS